MGQKRLLPAHVISSLPDIVKREILHPTTKDKDFGMDVRKNIAQRLITAFQMSFDREDYNQNTNGIKPIEIAMAEFGAYLKSFPIAFTGEEILEAYRMASRGELRDFHDRIIEFYPNLKNAQAGKILTAYQRYKIDSVTHTQGIQKLKKLIESEEKPTISPEAEKEHQKAMMTELVRRVKENTECDFAFLFFDRIVKKGVFNKFLSSEKSQSRLLRRRMIELITKEKLKTNSYSYNSKEINGLIAFFDENTDMIRKDLNFSYGKLKASAIVHLKNDLVYLWIKKQVRLKRL